MLGQETDKVAVSVGQRVNTPNHLFCGQTLTVDKAINERIKELDFQDCKVRVTNVDSQSSDSNIVIQVIGEISNKAAPHKKFTQTFVLAGQTNGYFVLNDIFRYIVEEEDEAEPEQAQPETVDAGLQEPAPTLSQSKEPETLTSSEDPAAIENDVKKVNKQLEEKVLNNPSSEQMEISPAPANGVSGAPEDENKEIIHAEEAPVAAIGGPTEEASTAASTSVAEENLSPEKPKDPEPTPTMSPVKQAAQPAAQPASPAASSSAPSASSKPSVPKSWASLAAAAHKVATPVTPIPQAANSAAPAQPKAAPVPAAPSASTPTAAPATPATAPAREASPASSQQDEWTSVGGDNKKQQSKVQAGAGAQEGPQSRAYIKNVNDSIDAKDLRNLLEKFGEIVYFDVSRQKVGNENNVREFCLPANQVNRTAHLLTSSLQKPTRPPLTPTHTSLEMSASWLRSAA